MREFDWIALHVSAGQGLLPEDQITHLLASWPEGSLVGDNLRLDQESLEYRASENVGDLESRWAMLLIRLKEHAIEPAIARRKAEAAWRELYWTGDLDSFNLLFRQALTGLRRNHISKVDTTLKWTQH